jgi:glycosyltransferase involved in cell wall biosynthesis
VTATSTRPVVLVLLGHYVPGYKAGGPIRSIANMVEALGDELDFRIVTCDRDIGDVESFVNIRPGERRRVGKAQVTYLPNSWCGLWAMIRLLLETPADLVYLNSFFARRYSMLAVFLRRLRVFRPKSLLLAPRGEFSEGALRIKNWKKRAYLALARWTGLYANVFWHASSQFEEQDIHHALFNCGPVAVAWPITGQRFQIMTAVDMPGALCGRSGARTPAKASGHIRLIFLSRICRKKNLDGAILMLNGLQGEVEFDIYGPIEDQSYWNACQNLISELPPNIVVKYRGEAHHDFVHQILSGYDALLFPTHGENYGHVIREALSAGCPVIISDQTPWRELASLGVGWDLPLQDREQFRAVMQRCIEMAPDDFGRLSRQAGEYGLKLSEDPEIIGQNRRLFAKAIGQETVVGVVA